MKFKNTLAATNSNEILAVIAGLPVDANGYFLNEEQMTNIEASLTEASEFQTLNTALTEKFDAQSTQLQTATADLATANASIATKDAEIAQLKKDLAAANETAAGEFETTSREKDLTGQQAKAHLNPNSSLNRAADGRFN